MALDINERREIVGFSSANGSSPHAVVWAGGRLFELPTAGVELADAKFVNERGEIAGEALLNRVLFWRPTTCPATHPPPQEPPEEPTE
jgi:probable HAF family extracellular repeat protein